MIPVGLVGLDEALAVVVCADDEGGVGEALVDECGVVEAFDSIFSEEELDPLLLAELLRGAGGTVLCSSFLRLS